MLHLCAVFFPLTVHFCALFVPVNGNLLLLLATLSLLTLSALQKCVPERCVSVFALIV